MLFYHSVIQRQEDKVVQMAEIMIQMMKFRLEFVFIGIIYLG